MTGLAAFLFTLSIGLDLAIAWGVISFALNYIGSYIEPVIAGRALAISPLVMLVAFFFWAFLWEIPGAFIGIPMTITLLTICEQNPRLSWLAGCYRRETELVNATELVRQIYDGTLAGRV
jgi:hypothetical protein